MLLRWLALFSVCSCFAAEPVPNPLLNWMDSIAQKQLDAREAAVRAIHDTAGAEQRKAYVRAKVLELMGGLPDYSGPLNARVTGEVRAAGFVIEKVIFESLPRVYVTANLYRPDQPGKFPGILLPLGHWDYGKPAVQRIAGNLALKGFVVLTYDPFGQGERQQLYDARLENSLAEHGTEQHLLAGGLSVLLGQSFARYRIWDAKRALDYLVSRPEVITEKIGCTGCSGGGTLTTYISALDPRIKVAAPACYINTFRMLFSGPLGDSEQSLPRFLVSGLDIADYIELFAPKPWLISSTREDFFPLEGSRLAYEEARRWYGIYGAEGKIQREVGPGGHGTPLEIREAIYGWMIRWLKDGAGSAKEQEVTLLPEHALWAAPGGQVANMEGSREVFDVLREDFARKSSRPRAELVEQLRELIQPPARAPEVRIEGGELRFQAEAGLEVRGSIHVPAGAGRHPAVLLVQMQEKVPARAEELAREGNVVLCLAPRGLPGGFSSRAYSGDWLPNVRAWLIGRNLPAMRAHDILDGVAILKRRPDVDAANIRAEAEGIGGVWLLMAAAVDGSLKQVTVSQTPYSFARAFENPLTRNLHSAIVPGLARSWDIGDLVEPARVIWVDPSDWLGHVVRVGGRVQYTAPGQ